MKNMMDFNDPSKPMSVLKDDELSLQNPYSKASCLILYLYSMELGDPPLYAEVNRICRT